MKGLFDNDNCIIIYVSAYNNMVIFYEAFP